MAFGPPLVIGEEFAQVAGIEAIHIYGSWAARHAGEPGPPPNDIDVLVIGGADRDDLDEAARRAQRRLGREVNVTQRIRKRWQTATDGFTEQVRNSPMTEVPSPGIHDPLEHGK